MACEIRAQPFDPWQTLADYQGRLPPGQYGATSVFVGTMRNMNEQRSVQAMTLEHYPGMTEKHLNTICEEAGSRWQLLDCLIVHRTGEISVNDPIVLVAVWSAHRGGAIEACRFLIEELKHRAPFWKKERLSESEESRWVSGNSNYGDHA
ncbi:MAG: molybdenum cofactor biosynthesis protein MoaE [Gammaproteobacteria bacterium]|nr:molybdenum cofactor biosynthesis protein MoaE [Gammaproteobacteria bacterium]